MTPKQRFLASEHAKPFFDMAVNPTLLTALEYAMLEMVQTEAIGPDLNGAMRSGLRIDGARQFVTILKDLPVIPEQSKNEPSMPANLPEP